MAQKRAFNEGKRHFKKNKKQKPASTGSDGSNVDVLLADVRALLKTVRLVEGTEVPKIPELGSEVQLEISEISSTGDGLAERDGKIYVVPFTAPGDTVVARVHQHDEDEGYSLTDFVSIVDPSSDRTEQPKCRYFSECSGCQFQHLPYSYQLEHKRRVVEKAFKNFSQLPPEAIPPVEDTVGSPLQYGYRTKLTPHFDGPLNGRRDRRNGQKPTWAEVPPIGFMKKGKRKVLDIEDCPIGTESVQRGLKRERIRVAKEIDNYQRGATILLRETTEKLKGPKPDDQGSESDTVWEREENNDTLYKKTCITNHNATSTEYVDHFRLDNPAGSFFQNNNSILPLVTKYVRENILGKPSDESTPKIKNMIDAYCGSGFFTITLSSMFQTSIGIDIAAQSIDYASRNADLNNLPAESTRFIAADANQLFASIDKAKYPPHETAVVIDPPRKGCDQGFIRQLIAYGPERVCYVSCNVHTQARDVGWLVGGLEGEGDQAVPGSYEIESIRGFDFFPQTSHVEGVAILRRRSEDVGSIAP